MKLGFPAKVLGRGGVLKDYDSRRWQSGPHLRVSLSYLNTIFDYLAEERITMYRISSNIAPYITHPELPQFHNQIEECAEDLAHLGTRARRLGLRLSMHPNHYTVLNSPVERVYEGAVRDLIFHGAFMDALGLGQEAVVVVHGGGVFGDKQASMERFAARYERLPEPARRRLVLENDEKSYSVQDVCEIHRRCGIPLVLDTLHHRANNPGGLSNREAAHAMIPTWPHGVRPKIHFSSARQEDRSITRRDRATGERVTSVAAALRFQHADWVGTEEFAAFLADAAPLVFDVMVEAKRKDLAMLKLRSELRKRGIDTE
jgi:UV DNA damage endonuclease